MGIEHTFEYGVKEIKNYKLLLSQMEKYGRIREVTEDMGMLKSISLENYKCFKKLEDLEIAPLTVLCGANSCGKSTILKSLLTLKQSTNPMNSSNGLLLNGDYVNNGDFDNIYSKYSEKNNEKSITFTFQFNLNSYFEKTLGKYIPLQDAESFKQMKRIYSKEHSAIEYFKLNISITFEKPQLVIDNFSEYINSNKISKYHIDIYMFDKTNCEIERRRGFIEYRFINKTEFLIWENIPSYMSITNSYKGFICKCSFVGLQISDVYSKAMPEDVKQIIPNILSITRIVSKQFSGIEFIAPLRTMPERDYKIKSDATNVGISGEYTSVILAKKNSEYKEYNILPPLTEDLLIRQPPKEMMYNDLLKSWLEYLDMGEYSITGNSGNVDIFINSNNIVDVGFGVSQVLPIIVQGLNLTQEQLLLLEQPEIHLHPKMQMRLADFLIELAYSNRNVIIETHSDHIINRLIRRILEDDSNILYNDLIKIYYFEKEFDNPTTKNEIEIDPYSGIINWPDGFFDQFQNEQELIMKAGLNKRARRDKI